MIQKITLIGAGNLATCLGKSLKKNGFDILQVYSHTEESAKTLAEKLNTKYTYNTKDIDLSADLIIISIKDDAIGEMIDKIKHKNLKIVHTSGSVSMQILKTHSYCYGVFYPIMTLSKNRDIDFSDIPICLEANSDDFLSELKEMAERISSQVFEIHSKERKILHMAAVFANNFVNHFYDISENILKENGLSFDLLKPLIKETASKIMELSPHDAQTGPARRFDKSIINRHLKLLENNPKREKIYRFVTDSIISSYKENK
ncbi:MAG: DUF2520 domain-containing protein [Prolixibacteraceae bacterium]|nr:DUF2520 domain-containing protein [Prolixibacteraceae bacterium]